MRNRRELRLLREFVSRIEGTYGAQDDTVATVPCDTEWVRQKMRGMSWGANGRVVFLASCERADNRVTITVVRTPERAR
jgi:hypothetical protein